MIVADVIPLTQHLVKWIRSKARCPPGDAEGVLLENLSREQIAPFLAKNFHWRVADLNGTVHEGQCDFVKVEAVDRLVRLPNRYEDEVQFDVKEGEEETSGNYGPTAGQPAGGYGTEKPGEQVPGGDCDDDTPADEGRKCCGLPCSVM